MRWVICALFMLLLTPCASAADLDALPSAQTVGPATFTRWSGFYVGAQVGYSAASADFSQATSSPIAYALRQTLLEADFAPSEWPVLGSGQGDAVNFGGFIGYNTQFQDLILGVEANFEDTSNSLTATTNPISRLTSPDAAGHTYLVNITGSGSMKPLDYGALRVRAGWALGNFLPYGFAGVALGQANISVTATVQGEQNPPINGGACNTPCSAFFYTNTSNKNGAVIYGFVAGGGLDYALTSNIFLRGEFEFVQFAPVSGILATIVGAHVGAGLKF